MDAFTPQQTVELVSRIGTKKAGTRLDKLFVNSLLVGPLLGFGCAVTLSTEAAPWFQTNAPGLIRTIAATYFPIGLVMIVLSGADLFTSNIMFTTAALLERRISIVQVFKINVVSFFGNLAGTLFFMAIVTGYGGVFSLPAYKEAVFTLATQKMVLPEWHQIMLRAIGANWLVCFAVFISISAREIASKIIAIWFPTATFVALGLDHVIANMYFIPTAIFYGHPIITTSFYIWKSLIPTLIGNIIGGGLFVAAAYWYLYLTGEGSVQVDFNIGSLTTAMEAGGPMGPDKKSSHAYRRENSSTPIINGQVPPDGVPMDLPHSGSNMQSGIAKELSEEKYGKSMKSSPEDLRDRAHDA